MVYMIAVEHSLLVYRMAVERSLLRRRRSGTRSLETVLVGMWLSFPYAYSMRFAFHF